LTLSYPEDKAHATTSQGLLTIARPKALGGDLEIPLGRGSGKHMPTVIFASEKDQKRCRFTVCYGFWRRCVTVRAATDALYQAWWAALETAYMSLELKQISRALATNFDVLPEPEPEQESDLEDISVMNDEMANVPLLEYVRSVSDAEADDRESWLSSESPDELVVISSMTDCSSGDELPNKPAVDCTRELDAVEDKSTNKVSGEPRDVKPSALGSSDANRIGDSLIESDVLEHLPSDGRDLMDSSSSNGGWSTGSSLNSDVVALLPSDLQDMLESCGSDCSHGDGAQESECCDLSNESFDIVGRRCHDTDDGASSRSEEQPEDSATLPETGGGIILDGVLLTAEAARIRTTRNVFALPFRSTQTPFERLRERQRRRAAMNDPVNHTRGMAPASSTPRNPIDVDSGVLPKRPSKISSFRPYPSAEDVYGPRQEPPTLVVGRINGAHVEEIEQFASRHVPDADRSPKKTLVIERVTRAWTDVARFAFRPHAVTDHVANKHRHESPTDQFHAFDPTLH
jgi:hypothetical protein